MAVCFIAVLSVAALAQRRFPGRMGGENTPPPVARNENEKRIIAALNDFRETGPVFQNVPMNDGKMLRLLAEAVNAKTVVEIGTSTGYSGLWFTLALVNTGGRLITFEIDPGRASAARKRFQQAGVDKLVTIVEGDAHERIKELKGPIDVAFIDADKEGYVDYLNKLLPLVRPGGLILAHNVSPGMQGESYVKQVTSHPELETVFYLEGGGLGITLKKH
jgi:predicted O-methyltransferase YrrM